MKLFIYPKLKISILKTYCIHHPFILATVLFLSCLNIHASNNLIAIDTTGSKEHNDRNLTTEFENTPLRSYFDKKLDSIESKEKQKSILVKKSTIVTYKIYQDGTIHKVIPKTIAKEFKNKYRYIYIDKKGKKYDLGDFTFYKTQLYRGIEGEMINLINLEEVPKTYKKGTHQYHFNMDSPRSYVNEQTLASFFGAMLEVNYLDIGCNGFSHKDGSSKPSRSHINGNNGDFKYLRTDKTLKCGPGTSLNLNKAPDSLDYIRQNKWNEALYKFGWKSMLGWTVTINKETKYLQHISHKTTNHHHHLHVQNYEPQFKEIIQ
ncbi:hypothetical protein [Flavobacterium sp. 7A]|uniref:hypothetical protein n=1 Tax=Flavobacterium sp. 7A TaxID=2940571 RepID=UPI002226F813|nr:hypothetical protein [Flavobacterium sp. 7A]MCW2120372.1 hypothetical protein [Flavobacterium sp. 7A]